MTHLSRVHVTQDISARRVAAAVARHVQQLGWATERDLDLAEDWQLTQEHLQHTGINADGVVNQIRRQLDHVGVARSLHPRIAHRRGNRLLYIHTAGHCFTQRSRTQPPFYRTFYVPHMFCETNTGHKRFLGTPFQLKVPTRY